MVGIVIWLLAGTPLKPHTGWKQGGSLPARVPPFSMRGLALLLVLLATIVSVVTSLHLSAVRMLVRFRLVFCG
jgi:hypothetical protein